MDVDISCCLGSPCSLERCCSQESVDTQTCKMYFKTKGTLNSEFKVEFSARGIKYPQKLTNPKRSPQSSARWHKKFPTARGYLKMCFLSIPLFPSPLKSSWVFEVVSHLFNSYLLGFISSWFSLFIPHQFVCLQYSLSSWLVQYKVV